MFFIVLLISTCILNFNFIVTNIMLWLSVVPVSNKLRYTEKNENFESEISTQLKRF